MRMLVNNQLLFRAYHSKQLPESPGQKELSGFHWFTLILMLPHNPTTESHVEIGAIITGLLELRNHV